MDWTLEVVVVPVSDVEASIAFYRDRVGFALDHDTDAGYGRIVQLTPRGSGCSVVLGTLPPMQRMAPGSLHGLQLVVPDARAAHAELVGRGVACEEVTALDERDGGTLFGFADPDGNSWVVQEIRARGGSSSPPRDPAG
ncbi:VOC family protein [Phycicoccus flavus]|uniref:VOC family protein n=1 Tax=Phycicoccus flavus TaxID=2502783 RepID=UPI000FEB6A1A|nr:VOC family protein [Phycicoccus flavus]NHA66518.1 VOC family protein [Phycicoccus flavus]